MRTLITCALMATLLLCACDEGPAPSAVGPGQAAASIDVEKIEASLSAASQYLQSAQIVEAEAILRTLVARAPQELRGHELLGQTLTQKATAAEQTGDAATAAALRREVYECYARAVKCDPTLAGLQHSAGIMAMAAQNRQAALSHFLEAERLDPLDSKYALFAAQLLMQSKRLGEAETAIERALAIDPSEPYARATLAMIALERGEHERALAEMTTARQGLPDDVGLRAQHAKIHRRMNQPRLALELLVGLDDADRAQEAAAFEIAAAYDMLGDPMKAAGAWEVCLQSGAAAPADRRAFAAVQAARLYLKAGSIGDAARCSSVAAQLDPHATQTQEVLAEIRAATTR